MVTHYPFHWKTAELGKSCKLIMGQSPPGSSYNTEKRGLPLLQGPTDLTNGKGLRHTSLPKKKCEKGDILIAVRATIGDLWWAEDQYAIGRGLAAIRPHESQLDKDFVFYFLLTQKPYLMGMGKGSTFKAIRKEVLTNLKIPLPSLDEQQKIVEWLNKLSQILNKDEYHWSNYWNFSMPVPSKKEQEKMLKKLNNLVKMIEDLKAGRDGLKKKVDNVFDSSINSLMPTEELPERWKFEPAGTLVVKRKRNVEPSKLKGKQNYIGLENIEAHTGNIVKFSPTEATKIKSTKVVFQEGDVLYGKLRPYLNKVVIAPFDGIASTDIIPLTVNEEIRNDYFANALRMKRVVNHVMGLTRGARMPRTSLKVLSQIKIPFPEDKSEQRKIVSRLDNISEKIKETNEEQERLDGMIEMLPKSVLTKVFEVMVT